MTEFQYTCRWYTVKVMIFSKQYYMWFWEPLAIDLFGHLDMRMCWNIRLVIISSAGLRAPSMTELWLSG